MLTFFALAAMLSMPGPFTLRNETGATLSAIAVRPIETSGSYKMLRAAPISAGARADLPSPGGTVCAFDIQADVAGTVTRWSAVNLCDVKVVTLNRRADGTLWVDYD